MKKATFRVREIRTFEFDMYFDEYLSLADMEKAAEENWSERQGLGTQRETEPVNVLVGIKRDEYGDVAVRRITNDSPWWIIRSMGEWQVSDGPVGERSVSYDFKTREEAEEWIAAQQQPTREVKLFWANGSYCTTSGNMNNFNFAVRDVSLEGATRRAEQIIKGDRRRRYSGKLDMEVCAAGNY